MATININKTEFLDLVGKKLTNKEIEETVSSIGMSFENWDGNNFIVDITANRPDLLSQCGLARAVASFLEIKKEVYKYKVNKSDYVVKVENQTNDWPYVVTAVVKGLTFTDEKIKEVIQIQEKLGATFLRNRKKGGIGVYPLNKIKFPIKYTSELPEKIKFRPLESSEIMSAKEILEKHPTGREYGHITHGWKKIPVFIDGNNKIMSMPPIINAHDLGKITEETSEVFLEATGTNFNTISFALNILVTALADMGGKIYSTKLVRNGKTIEVPNLEAKEFEFDPNYVNKILGLELKNNEIKNLLAKMGYGIANKENVVLVPSYRTDILHQTDIVEDVVIAYGYSNLKEEIPKVATIAEESKVEIFKKKIANIMIGLGLIEVHTYNLTSKENQVNKMHTAIKCVELANALNADYNVLRAWLTPTMMQILKDNKHNEYPQNIFGFGEVFKYDEKSESGVDEAVRLSVALCHTNANFTQIKQILDSLAKALDVKYEIKETEHNSFISGRVGRISVRGVDIAYIGEIHPQVLEEFSLDVPVAVLELNLTELFRLVV